VTLAAIAKVNIIGKVWGFLPVPLYGITVSKEISQPAFNDFKDHPIQLANLISSQGGPGQLSVTASAHVYNPSPVTMLLHDPFQLQVLYPFQGKDYKLGTLFATPPLELRPGANLPNATVQVVQTKENGLAIRDFISKYIGPQEGFSPAGGKSQPLRIRMVSDGENTSPSQLVCEATDGLSVSVDFQEKNIFFLWNITADIYGSLAPPFWKIIVHLAVNNPVPGIARVKQVNLTAHHLNMSGQVLYHYNHDIVRPKFDPTKYVMKPFENLTVDFPLNPITEVDYHVLGNGHAILDLMKEGLHHQVTLGIELNLTVEIDDGFEQVVPYENNALCGALCFSVSKPKQYCGGLAPNSRLEVSQNLETVIDELSRSCAPQKGLADKSLDLNT